MNQDGNESYRLRSISADNFILPKPNTELYKICLAFSGPIIWNYLPNNVKGVPIAESFHKRCMKRTKAE